MPSPGARWSLKKLPNRERNTTENSVICSVRGLLLVQAHLWKINGSWIFLRGVIRAGTEWFREGSEVFYCSSQNTTAEIVAAVEESISQLNDERRNLVRAEVTAYSGVLNLLPKNIQKDVFNALIALKKDPDRLVLSADKGNCVVVRDKQQYHDKALSLPNDKSTYAVLNSDPICKTQRKLNKMLLDLKKSW